MNYVSTHQGGPDEIIVISCLPGATQLLGTTLPHPIPDPPSVFRLSVYVLSTFFVFVDVVTFPLAYLPFIYIYIYIYICIYIYIVYIYIYILYYIYTYIYILYILVYIYTSLYIY